MNTNLQTLQRRIGSFPIELPAAAAMAIAVAFLMFALPDWRFERLIAATGLPAIVGAAQPPLGTTARTVAALGLAGLSFLVVWFGLRALDAKPSQTDFPAFRAADLHPDAPRRRPILAEAEFGAPADDLPPIEDQLVRRKPVLTEPLPSFLAPQPPAIGDFMAEPLAEPEQFAEQNVDPRPEPHAEAQPEPDDSFFAPSGPEPLPVEIVEDEAWPVEASTPRFMDTVSPARPHDIEQASNDAFEEPSEAEEDEDQSVGNLMARLEGGLARRGSKPLPGLGGSAQEELRRALGDLNRIGGRS